MSKFFYTTIAFLGLILQLSGLQASEVYSLGVDVHGEPLVFGRDYEIQVYGGKSKENLKLFVSNTIKGGDNVVEAHYVSHTSEPRNIFTIERPTEPQYKNHVRLYNKATGSVLFSSLDKYHNLLKIAGRGVVNVAGMKLGENFAHIATEALDLKSGEYPTFYVQAHNFEKSGWEQRNNLRIFSVEKDVNEGQGYRNLIQILNFNWGTIPNSNACFLFVSEEKEGIDNLVLSCVSLGTQQTFKGYPEFIFVPII